MSATSYNPRFLQDIPDTLSPTDHAKLALANTLGIPQRVALYEGLIESYAGSPQQALNLTRLADLLTLLGSGSLAVGLYRKAQKIFADGNIVDNSFDEFLDRYEAQMNDQAKESLTQSKKRSYFQTWKATNEHTFPQLPQAPPESDQLKARWQALTPDGSTLFAAYLKKLAIETNHVESTFLLTEGSTQDIVRRGVSEGTVNYLPESALQDPLKIKTILNDTLAAYDLIKTIVVDVNDLSPEMIRRIHNRLMKTCQYTNAIMTPAGRTRTETQKTVIVSGMCAIECCPYPEVDKELEYICKMAKQWIKNWRNPFATASWIHLVFVRCHPFEDGNGRMARLLASIPLMKHGFPPVAVSLTQRSEYYEGIRKAYDGKHEALVGCFLKGMQETIDSVKALSTDP